MDVVYGVLYELLDKAHILRDDFARTVHLLNHRQHGRRERLVAGPEQRAMHERDKLRAFARG